MKSSSRSLQTLTTLTEQAKRGDSAAVHLVLDDHGWVIRRELSFSTLHNRLRRIVDEDDLFQAVVTRFIVGLKAGRYNFQTSRDVVNLLRAMTRTTVVDATREWTAARRDVRRNVHWPDSGAAVNSNLCVRPSQDAVDKHEILGRALELLSNREKAVLYWREEGLQWNEIATELGGVDTGEAVRKQHERAMAKVTQHLNVS